MGRIVVGVDGSPESRRALEFAVQEAAFRDAELEIVYAFPAGKDRHSGFIWGYDSDMVTQSHAGPPEPEATDSRRRQEIRRHDEDLRIMHSQARSAVESLIQHVVPTPGPVPKLVLMPDEHPAQALVSASEGADMLVVGSRGRGGFTGLVLGSVSQQCIHHARCPVTVVRGQ
jgi:nucleotide-binding universal stress UspA family protein